VPSAVLQLAGAFAALGVGASTERIGRRLGLGLGLAIGVLGMALAAGAIVAGTLLLFLGGLAFMGVASAAMQLGRFAVAEVHPAERRGRAISNVVIGNAVGSVAGPLVVGASGRWALQAGVNELAGPFAAASLVLALATLVIFGWLRPDPRDVGRKIEQRHPEMAVRLGPSRTMWEILRTPAPFVALFAMTFGGLVMVMVMVITSLHMQAHQYVLADISLVISIHTFGMYALSPLSGRLADRWGRGLVVLVGAGLLVLACVLAPLSTDLLPLGGALFLLGWGWNFCYVGGSALLSDQLSAGERGRTQGAFDLLRGLATALISVASGLIFAAGGYALIGAVGTGLSLLLLGLTAWWLIRGRRRAEEPVQSAHPATPAHRASPVQASE
jgi:MFS family permease